MELSKSFFKVDRHEIAYLRYVIESYDGMAIVTTLDPREAMIEIKIAPGCEELVNELITSLRVNEGIRLDPAQGKPCKIESSRTHIE